MASHFLQTVQVFHWLYCSPLLQIFQSILENVQYVMAGYNIPEEEAFSEKIDYFVDTLFKSLKDPSLPLKEMQELMSAISSRIPPSVDESIQACLTRYASNITSVLSQFPSAQIINIINRHAASIKKRSDHDQFFMNTNAIMQLAQKYVWGWVGEMGVS